MVSVEASLAEAHGRLDADPAAAEALARDVLAAHPGHPGACFLQACAWLAQGQAEAATTALQALAGEQAGSAQVHWMLARALARTGRRDDAIEALAEAARLAPAMPGVWLALAELRREAGDAAAAEADYLRHVAQAPADPELMAAAQALAHDRLPEAEQRLRQRLKRQNHDIAAMRMLAELGLRVGRNEQAQVLLERCLALAPGFRAARRNLALALDRGNRHAEALLELDTLLHDEPEDAGLRNQKAVVLGKLGQYGDAIGLYEGLLRERPLDPRIWLSLGHALKTEGHRDRAIAAYRRATELQPGFGTAWWSLANMKTVRLDAGDVARMRAALAAGGLDDEQQLNMQFALGKALEDAGDPAGAFAHYRDGNARRRRQLPYDAGLNRERRQRAERLYTREFFARRAGAGHPARDPIFILGMPRAGSTLLEQILGSHPEVEATMELPEVIAITRDLRLGAASPSTTSYHDVVEAMPPEAFAALGERYLARTRVQRRTAAPLFIDKMPNNHAHVGLIHLMLPNARIIDARRHPMACGFSNFKQHFARGQAFSYDLADIGAYYADYVALMAHFDDVLPGRVHRVVYEDLVADTEAHVRALLDYCGLPFDERCLRFFENGRAVRTASSEQVRQPIYREGVDHWRQFEPWLGPLADALGPVLDHYPAAPPAVATRHPAVDHHRS